VADFFFASDIGIMFRDDSIVNRTAWPVKLSEYLASGILCLTNQEYIYRRDPNNIVMLDENNNFPVNVDVKGEKRRQEDSLANCSRFSAGTAVKRIIEKL
jgi:hypothetical protein